MNQIKSLLIKPILKHSQLKNENSKMLTTDRKINMKISASNKRNKQLLPEIKTQRKLSRHFKKQDQEICQEKKLIQNLPIKKKYSTLKNSKSDKQKIQWKNNQNLFGLTIQDSIPLIIEYQYTDKDKLFFNLDKQTQILYIRKQQNQSSKYLVPVNKDLAKQAPRILQDRWKIGGVVGNGTTADVFRAFDNYNGSLVAAKKIFLEKDFENYDHIKSELAILCKINHVNIVKYYDHYKQARDFWIFMEYLPQNIQLIYKRYGKISFQNIKSYTRQLLLAIKYLHQHLIIHKDIKCSNILIDSQGIIKLSDFGSSKQIQYNNSTIQYQFNGAMSFQGSILWMAPQVIKNNKYGRKSDIWSLGCSILQMATGELPWSNENFDNQLTAIVKIGLSQDIPLIPQQLDGDLKDFIRECLVRDPQKRKSAQQLLQHSFILY